MAKRTCSECGGPKMGRGFSHKAGCSLARPAGSRRGTGRRGRRSAGSGSNGSGIDLRVLRGMEAEALMKLRSSIDGYIKSKAPLLKAKIKSLQETLNSIR